ncbi:MAG: transcriptional repressor [Hyphomicrobium sp.]|nr:transcriptional repressor [Hyphomicrobium sp.]
MSTKKADLAELCRKNGRRLTGQRRVIAEVVSAAHDHPDVVEIHRRAAQIDPRIALSTVYRTLRMLAEIGLVETHTFDGGRARVERATGEHHDHLIDTTTGKVIEFRSDAIERLQAEIAHRLGYELTGHRLELYARPMKSRRRSR